MEDVQVLPSRNPHQLLIQPKNTILGQLSVQPSDLITYAGGSNHLETINYIYDLEKTRFFLKSFLALVILEYLMAFLNLPFDQIEKRPVLSLLASYYHLILFAICSCILPLSSTTIPNYTALKLHIFTVIVQFIGFILYLASLILILPIDNLHYKAYSSHNPKTLEISNNSNNSNNSSHLNGTNSSDDSKHLNSIFNKDSYSTEMNDINNYIVSNLKKRFTNNNLTKNNYNVTFYLKVVILISLFISFLTLINSLINALYHFNALSRLLNKKRIRNKSQFKNQTDLQDQIDYNTLLK
ncbi:uncharacterized protein ASCRUDRAFT_10976 [Ascoidea rubescens DSM 1968]|uniref:Uncharacterized protein n=1 Tax=Ascoidea rubescens DSM 1968 TaxID=1344418 RepID=A0A1D2VPI2_9ASCO|nr:hypothetical protein ASCRUDRAFT_10976 [Ascoidea rubescens DSM 1968]ODV63494.1 hypothetical protein ASCRUDRAFT_10976 [Ascoidea rubescens DSM 1968]